MKKNQSYLMKMFFIIMCVGIIYILNTEAISEDSNTTKKVSLNKLKNLSENDLAREVKESILKVESDEIREHNVKEIRELIKEKKSKEKNLTNLKKSIIPEFVKILDETAEDTTLTQDVASVLPLKFLYTF